MPYSTRVDTPDLIPRAAARILAQQADDLPDLSGALVLVPNFHAAHRLEAALAAQSGCAILIPPHVTTFPAWAEGTAPDTPLLPDSRRTALLYQVLKARGWFDAADLWGVCAELVRLFDELTLNAVALPASLPAFAAQLRAAYQARADTGLEFEARLVHELWYALSQDAQSRAAHYALRLSRLAEQAQAPLFVVGLPTLSRLERECLARYGERQPVTYITHEPAADGVSEALAAAWPAGPLAPSLKTRAEALAAALPQSPLAQRVALYAARSMEDEARAADTQIRLWLAEGRQRIAVIVQDRLSARRLRALLERAQVLVADETGWALDTTAASTVLMRWLDVLSGGFRHEDVLDLLKSPYLLADSAASQRKEAAWQLETALRRHGPVAGARPLMQLLSRQAERDAALAAMARLEQAAALLSLRAARPLAAWLAQLGESLVRLGAQASLQADAAGQQLLALLERRRHELLPDPGRFGFDEFRRWLAGELAGATFLDAGIDSPVVFTHLAATRLRAFDGALLLGADAAHLPAPGAASVFFNQRVRAALGLPTRAEALAQTEADLTQLIVSVPAVRVLWRARQDGETNPVSPWFERLDTLHRLAWHSGLTDRRLAALLAAAQVAAPAPAALPAPTQAPRPVLGPSRLPARISVSAYNSLLACPYQYFARHVLRLNELDDISAELDKSDYGRIVHAILKRFHERYPVITGVPRDAAAQALLDLTQAEFEPALADDYFARAWQYRWVRQIPLYLDWQLAREREGWRWQAGEIDAERSFALAPGGSVTLHGRIDRVDSLAGSRAVLDYKTGATQSLKEKAEAPGEDVQLSAYALLLGEDIAQAAFVALEDRARIETLSMAEEPDAAAQATRARLLQVFELMHAGAPLPAQGSDRVCGWCEMRGLCRKDYWPQA